MGYNLYFYAHPEDIDELLEYILSKGDCYLLTEWSDTPIANQIDKSFWRSTGKTGYCFYLARPHDLENIVFGATGNRWSIDSMKSPVIELDTGHFLRHVMRKGRLYFNPSFAETLNPAYAYTGNKEWQEYIQWARRLLNRVRRRYHRDSQAMSYILPKAREWIKAHHARYEYGEYVYHSRARTSKNKRTHA